MGQDVRQRCRLHGSCNSLFHERRVPLVVSLPYFNLFLPEPYRVWKPSNVVYWKSLLAAAGLLLGLLEAAVGLLVLAGGFLLRYIFVHAGQMSHFL